MSRSRAALGMAVEMAMASNAMIVIRATRATLMSRYAGSKGPRTVADGVTDAVTRAGCAPGSPA